jgi:protein-S-isoprenylcysteine O-methyltransferase Ste14
LEAVTFVLVRAVTYSALFRSWALLGYCVAFLLVMYLFVVLYEEPTLRAGFREPYVRYCGRVRRWWPGRRRERTACA